jgi:hypothetical protein
VKAFTKKANISNNIPPHNRHVSIVVRIPAIYPFQIPLRSSSMARCKLQKLCQEWQMDDGTFGDNEILVTSSVSLWLISIFFQPPQHTTFLQRTREKKRLGKTCTPLTCKDDWLQESSPHPLWLDKAALAV